ncbi:hypothetical protein KIW84_035814 [Lathyrus oleraceus]|uniref:Uncharacterized protein n=1 Tax=Pisum sativum TaxID=3888 RepID=A0A9D4Y741_PEA|nr:hypothetical protein KIW84_035814 [Pisum sativum]
MVQFFTCVTWLINMKNYIYPPHNDELLSPRKLVFFSYLHFFKILKEKSKMNQSQNISHQVGQTAGQAQEKGSNMMDKASNAAQSAKESCQETGQRMKTKAHETVDALQSKDASRN